MPARKKTGAAAATATMLRITQTKSTISHIARNRATARALGLKHIGQTVEVPANEATRGMVRQIRFLVEVEEIAAEAAPARAQASADGKAARSRDSAGGREKA